MAEQAQTLDGNLPEEIRKIKVSFDKVFDGPTYEKRRAKFKKHKELYKSELWPDDQEKSYSKAQVNYIFSNIEQTAPLLTDNRPIWKVQARSPRFDRLGDLYNRALEYVWDFRELDDEVFMAVKDDLLYGKAIMKVFWDADDEEIAYDLIDPSTFCIAPGYTKLWKAPWCGEKGRKPISWIRSIYPKTWMNVKPEGFDPGKNLTDCYSTELENISADVYQVWIRDGAMVDQMIEEDVTAFDATGKEVTRKEKKKTGEKEAKYPNGRLIVFTPTTVLDDDASPFEHGKPPYADLNNYIVNHEFWGMGEPEQIRELYKELNTQIQAIARRGRPAENPNYEVDPELYEGDIDQLKDIFFEGGNFLEVKAHPDGHPAFRVIETGETDRMRIEFINFLRQAIREMSSVNQAAEGTPSKKERQSATEIGSLLEATYTRIRQKTRNLESFVKRLNWLTVSLQQQYYDEPRYVCFQEETEEGRGPSWEVISNQAATAMNYYSRRGVNAEDEQEPEEEYQNRLRADEDYQSLLSEYGEDGKKLDPIYFPFLIQVQSSSTLPTDKQSLANLYLRLAGIQITEQSGVDAEAVLKALQIPDRQQILARKAAEKQKIMQAQMAGQGRPQMPSATGPRSMLAAPGEPRQGAM